MPCSPQQRRDLFEDKISSRKAIRAGLAQALDYLRRGDVLMIWKPERLGRSVKEVLTIADDLPDRGVTLRILTGTLAGTGIPDMRRIGGLGGQQRRKLTEALGG